MSSYVIDCEGDGLNPTKIHCLAWRDVKEKEVKATTSYDEMRELLLGAELLIGHHIQRFDIPHLERLLGIKIKARLIDTLAIAWYLEPKREKGYGLDDYGEQYGIKKPVVIDWDTLPIEDYIHRCKEDVKINFKLWTEQKNLLLKIYGTADKLWPFLRYMEFKIDCAREQERSRWKLDVELAQKTLESLQQQRDEKLVELARVMPRVDIITIRNKPKITHKKTDGELTAHGTKWFALLSHLGLPEDHEEGVLVITGTEDPNPNSPIQIKSWLKDLGWKPTIFKYVRDKTTKDVRAIPQVRNDKTGELCPNIVALYEIEPALEVLGGLSILNHRIPMLNGFLNTVSEDGYTYAGIQGLTNTLRFRHSVVVNLPKVDRPFGKEIRGCLTAIPGHVLCGSDMTSLEDRIKHHFLYPHDPKYVNAMARPDYDPHIALAVMAGMMTEAEGEFYTRTDAIDASTLVLSDQLEFKRLKSIRSIAKNGNYACQYGAGAPRIALTANISTEQAERVHEGYWRLNWAIKAVAEEQIVKKVDGQMWLYNPISEFWYSLREMKDRFSTLVQGSASYIFDMWVQNIRAKRPQLTAQFHDEFVNMIPEGAEKKMDKLAQEAIEQLNKKLKLNRQLDIKTQFGFRYSDIH